MKLKEGPKVKVVIETKDGAGTNRSNWVFLCSKDFYGWCSTIYMVLTKGYKDLAKILSPGGGEDS